MVKTRTHLLNQEVNKVHLDSIRLQDNFKELNSSVTHLMIQINEKKWRKTLSIYKELIVKRKN